MPRLTGSKVELAMKCLGPWALRQVHRLAGASDRGTIIHRYLEEVVRYGKARALENVPADYLDQCKHIDTTEIERVADDALPECAMAWSPATDEARFLQTTGRDYEACVDDEIPATADLIVEVGPLSRALRVIDYKSGRVEVDPPERNWQMKTLALMASRAFKTDKVQAEVWKLRDDGGWFVSAWTFDAFDLDGIAAELRDRLRKLAVVTPETVQLVTGDHCRWCPSAHACPAQTALIKAASGQSGELATAEDAGRAYALLVPLRDLVGKLEAQIEEWARREPIPLPDGRVLALETTEREYVNGAVAEVVIRELHGEDAARQCVEHKVSATKAGIQRALGKAARETLDAIRSRGGMKTTQGTRLVAK